jgi:hypothetical protein
MSRHRFRDSATDSAPAPGYNCCFTVEDSHVQTPIAADASAPTTDTISELHAVSLLAQSGKKHTSINLRLGHHNELTVSKSARWRRSVRIFLLYAAEGGFN